MGVPAHFCNIMVSLCKYTPLKSKNWFHPLVPFEHWGTKSRSFCEAVNCEQSEQEGKFLFALLWFSSHNYRKLNLYVFSNISIQGAFKIKEDLYLVQKYGGRYFGN